MILAVAALPSLARADDCAVIYGAFEKLSTAPGYASVVTMSDGTAIRSVAVGDTFYVEGDGKWMKIPLRAGGRLGMLKAFVADAAALEDCGKVGIDSIGGKSMTTYTYVPPVPKDMEGFAGAGDPQKLWIGADGLPYRMTAPQMEMTISYDDITAPIP